MRSVMILGLVATVIAGCDKPKKAKPTTPSTETTPAPVSSGNTGGGSSSGGSGGAVQAVRGAVQRIVEQNDMRNIHLYIEASSVETGKMPSVNDIYNGIKKEAPKLAQKIDDGTITLCTPQTREEIWAYETDALQKGGWVCSSSGVERMDAATLKQRLGR